MKTIVISQFNEDLSWINNLNHEYKDIRVYTKNIHKDFQIERMVQVTDSHIEITSNHCDIYY